MLIEHILYNLAIAIIIGVIYQQYTGRNPTWLIVAAAYLPDLDYILQFAWYTCYETIGALCPIMIRHGDFHNILFILILSVIFAWLYKRYLNGLFIDGIICIGIGGFAHLLEDICVYDNLYHMWFPISRGFSTWNILPETRNFMDIGDTKIIFVGMIFVIFALVFKFAIEGEDKFISYMNTYIKPLPSICVSIVINILKL